VADPDIDWVRVARRLADIRARMIHHDDNQLGGDDFDAEALQRLFASIGELGLLTQADHDRVVANREGILRLNLDAANRDLREARAETRRVLDEVAANLAGQIRERCNNRSVPARYRREGVLLAADWIDPAVPKDRYGDLLPAEQAGDGR